MEPVESKPSAQFAQQSAITEPSTAKNERCVAHYKPNIWSYEYLESLVRDYKVPLYSAQVEKLKEEFISVFNQVTDESKLQIIDWICKLGLSNLFEKEIMEAFDVISSKLKINPNSIDNLGTAGLCFRILRQHGYNVSQGLITDFLDEEGAAQSTTRPNIMEIIKLYEGSQLGLEDEYLLAKAKAGSYEHLKGVYHNLDDKKISAKVVDALGLPLHWRAPWFDVRQQIDAYDSEVEMNATLLELAKVNFNMVQATHQRDLRDLSRWWRSLGLVEKISFARDRLVESFAYALGIAPGPHYGFVRKCVTKVIAFILVLDDIYDVYGSPDELERFTQALDRWDFEEACNLPECMKICFSALCDTTNEIAEEIQKENGFNGALPYLRRAVVDFCKSMLTEARWLNMGYTPILEEYLNNAWISSSGSLLSMAVFLSARKDLTSEKLIEELEEMRHLIYYISLIIRLCNDEATTAAEIERGDSPSSILCYMKEANVTEEVARLKIKGMIASTWKKINMELLKHSPMQLSTVKILIMNAARVAHCFYNTGDGFGVQDGDVEKQIKRMLIDPLLLH